MEKRDRNLISKYAEYLSLGLEIAVGITAPILIGYWLDNYFDTSPWLLLAGCVTGMVNIFVIIFKLSKKLNEEQQVKKAAEAFTFLFFKITGGVFIFVLICSLFLDNPESYALTLGYLLSFLFVSSNLFVVHKLDIRNHQKFYLVFYVSLILRFMLVIASVIFILGALKIHQIYFTVSFIISYIFHSVIEIIFINKILETEN